MKLSERISIIDPVKYESKAFVSYEVAFHRVDPVKYESKAFVSYEVALHWV